MKYVAIIVWIILIIALIVLLSTNYYYLYSLYIITHSKDPLTPFIDLSHRRTHKILKKNWKQIRNEMLTNQTCFSPIKGDAFFQTIIDDNRWKKVYLKWYGEPPKYAHKLYPQTMNILSKCKDVKLAMFSMLEPGAVITPHRGPFRGCIRMHLTLVAPRQPGCEITVDGNTHRWKEGEIVSFDDTYEHSVKNNTNERRVVLFLDVERKMKMSWLNKYVIKYVAPATTRMNDDLEKQHTLRS